MTRVRGFRSAAWAVTVLFAFLVAVPSAVAQSILVYDENSMSQQAIRAVSGLGLAYTRARAGDFVSLLGSRAWDLVILDLPSREPTGAYETALSTYIAGGGRAIGSCWEPSSINALAPAFGFTRVSDHDAVVLYRWNASHRIFTTPNAVPNITGGLTDHWADNGPYMRAAAGAVELAGDTPGVTSGHATIVVGNGDRTIFNGFLFDDYGSADNDRDTLNDVVELLQNEIQFLLTGSDADRDGYTAAGGDCNDADPTIHPGARELCDGIDSNCDGIADDDLYLVFYQDRDADGYGNPAVSTRACVPPPGYVAAAGDCNDADFRIHPGAPEVCDDLDSNCDGIRDTDLYLTFYRDGDGDGFGDARFTARGCTPPSGYVAVFGDCNDADPAVRPGAPESCDGIDSNCDGITDEDLYRTFYRDGDGDGHGDAGSPTGACAAPTGYVSSRDDCDDANPAAYPGAPEACDGTDNDCDGLTDEDGESVFYRDADGDGAGDPAATLEACSAPPGYAASAGDCRDTDPAIHPGAVEVCDGVDSNCDGVTDEDMYATFYRDADGDGYGDAASTTETCAPPAGYAGTPGDCDDDDPRVHPGAPDLPDGIDNDCDGATDEEPAADAGDGGDAEPAEDAEAGDDGGLSDTPAVDGPGDGPAADGAGDAARDGATIWDEGEAGCGCRAIPGSPRTIAVLLALLSARLVRRRRAGRHS